MIAQARSSSIQWLFHIDVDEIVLPLPAGSRGGVNNYTSKPGLLPSNFTWLLDELFKGIPDYVQVLAHLMDVLVLSCLDRQ